METASDEDPFVRAARDMLEEPGPQATLERAVAAATDVVRHADEASITLIHGRGAQQRLETAASTSDTGRRLDALQYELREGPCVEAVFDHEVVRSADVGADVRWPAWGPRAAGEASVRSMLCLRMFTHADLVGGLNLYSVDLDAFDDDDVGDGIAIAAQAAIAVSSARQVANLRRAVDSRTVTGQATGFIMAAYDLDPDSAFRVLTRISSHTNRRLRDIAEEVVLERRLPDY